MTPGVGPPRVVKLVLLFLELFCGSGTQISAKCVMAFKVCHKSTGTCFLKKIWRQDRKQQATRLRLVPKKDSKVEDSKLILLDKAVVC